MGKHCYLGQALRERKDSRAGCFSIEYRAHAATLYSESGCNAQAAGEKLRVPQMADYLKDPVSCVGINI